MVHLKYHSFKTQQLFAVKTALKWEPYAISIYKYTYVKYYKIILYHFN